MDKSQALLEQQIKDAGKKQFDYFVTKYKGKKELGYILKSFYKVYDSYVEKYGEGLDQQQKLVFKNIKFAILSLGVDLINAIGLKRDLSKKITKVEESFN